MPYFHGPDLTSYYELHGTGEPLVLLCGLGGDHSFWATSVPLLARHFQVLVLDPRGGGLTDAPEAPYSMEQFADDLAALLDALGMRHANLLGFSMGGNIALAFALRYPERVKQLVLAATFATMNVQARFFLDAVLAVYAGGATPRQMFELIAPWLFSIRFLQEPAHATFLHYVEDEVPQPLYAWRNQYLAQRAFDVRTVLSQIAIPTLVLAGGEDRLVALEDAQLLAQSIPNAQLLVQPDAGHLLNYEAPDWFHQAVCHFLLSPAETI